jgi:hypothetical protein
MEHPKTCTELAKNMANAFHYMMRNSRVLAFYLKLLLRHLSQFKQWSHNDNVCAETNHQFGVISFPFQAKTPEIRSCWNRPLIHFSLLNHLSTYKPYEEEEEYDFKYAWISLGLI